MRIRLLQLAIIAIALQGCGTPSGLTGAGLRNQDSTPDGLIRVESHSSENLYVRPEHGIGGYDAIIVAPAFITYRRSSRKLDPNLEIMHLAALEQFVVDAAEEDNVSMVRARDNCAITVGVGFVDVALSQSNSAETLGEMILVIQYEDSMSGQSLLLHAVPKRIERAAEGTSRDQQIRDSFDRMIEELEMMGTLRAATKTPSRPRAGCEGNLGRVVQAGNRGAEQP